MSLFNKRNLLEALFILSFFSSLNSYTNKTYMRPLDSDFLQPTKTTFAELAAEQYDAEDLDIRHNLGVSAFGFWSNNGESIGRYFGVNEKSNVVVSNNEKILDVYLDFLIHEGESPESEKDIRVNLGPEQNRFGLDIFYICDLSRLLEKLYLKVDLPIERVENKMGLRFEGDDDRKVERYLKGEYANSTNKATLQTFLTNGKFFNKKNRTGFSDLDLSLGYRIFDGNKDLFYKCVLALSFSIPLGNKPQGEYLFEPVVGNNAHYTLGITSNNYFSLWEYEDKNLSLIFDLKYKYFFKNTQRRVLSIKNIWADGANWGQYYLLARNGQENEPLIPVANILTRNVGVSPGSQFEGAAKFLFNLSNFNFGLGGQFLLQQKENIRLKDVFNDDLYGVAAFDYNTANLFEKTNIIDKFDNEWLVNENIDISTPESSYLLASQLYLTISTVFELDNLDFGLKMSSGYCFVQQNSNLRGWFINLLIEASF